MKINVREMNTLTPNSTKAFFYIDRLCNKYLILWDNVIGEVDQAAKLCEQNRSIKLGKYIPKVYVFEFTLLLNQ